MEARQVVVGVFVVVVAAMSAGTAEAAGKSVDCSTLVVQMADCLPYVTNATVAKPEGKCCSGLKTVLKTNPKCLCEAFKNSAQFGITVNVSKAVTLPAACHVPASSVPKCGSSASPAGAPAVSPAGAPTSIANPPSASARASGVVPPATAPAEKGSSSTIHVSVGLVLVLTVGAIFSSF